MPFAKDQLISKQVVTVIVVTWGTLLLCGCVNRPLPPRPTVNELIAQSLAGPSLAEIEITDRESPIEYQPAYLSTDDQQGSASLRSHSSPDYSLDSSPIDNRTKIRIDEEFIETDIREALTILAEQAGADLVLDDQVTGVINSRIENLSIDQAIDKVLMPLRFVWARHGNQLIVCPPDPASPLFSYVATRHPYHPASIDTKTLVDSVPERLRQYVQQIEGSNLILVEAPDRIRQQILERFATIDQPIPQVVLEAIICVISPDSGFQFGLDWQHAVELNGENAFKLGAAGLALSSNYSRAGANALFDDFSKTSAFVKLLSENGYLTIRATPHVMAQDGESANIAINRQTYFSVQPPVTANSDNSSFFFQQEIQSVESGITLDITPRVRGDVVTIHIEKAEVSEDIRNANTELALNPFPIINRRSVSTTVHVKDGKTIVIGGLVQRETIDRVNRVPGLSRVPLLGYLFETTQRQTREAEVVIFISPRIVKPLSVLHDCNTGLAD